jgi:DNA-binding MarR family transcriptional regulator
MLEKKHIAMLEHAERHRHPQLANIRVCFETLALASAIDADCAVRLGKYGLSEGKFIILFLLQDQQDGLSPGELADQAGVTRATTTGLLDGLERDGFVARKAGDGDRRTVTVRLTERGEAISRDLFVEHSLWITSLFANLSDSEKRVLSQLLKKAWLKTDVALKTIPQSETTVGKQE